MKYSEQSDHDITPRVKFILLFKNVIFSRNTFFIYFPDNDTKNLTHCDNSSTPVTKWKIKYDLSYLPPLCYVIPCNIADVFE